MNSLLKNSLILASLLISFSSNSTELLDDKLKEALISTYNFSPKLKVEKENLYEKDELLPQAFSEFRPTIKGYYEKGKIDSAISGSNIISDGIRTETNSGITLTQPIFNGGSSLKKISEAKNKINSQRYIYKHNEQLVFLEAIRLYSSVSSKIKELVLNNKNVEFLKKQLDLAEDQFNIGELTLTDVSIAQSRLLLSKSDLIRSQSELFALSSKYQSLIGMKPNEPMITEIFPELKSEINKMKENLITSNPEIISIEFEIKSLKNYISSLHRKKFPLVKLEAEAQKNKGYFRSDSAREVLSAYATIDIPLYQSGLSSSKIRESKRKLISLQEFKKFKLNELKYNLDYSWSLFTSASSKINAYKKQIEANNKFLEGLKQELFLGERTLLDILDAEQELIESEFNLIKVYEQQFNSYFEILFYTGKLTSKNLNLPVNHFDETENFNDVKYRWLDLVE